MNNKNVIFFNIFIITIFSIVILNMYTSSKQEMENKIQQSVTNKLSDVKTSVLETLLQSVEELNAVSAIVIFNPDVTLSEFQNYSKQHIRHMSDDFILEWQPIVLHKDREIFEQKAKEQGLKNFYLWQPDKNGKPIPATKKEEYVPVYYLLSKNVDINTLGIDLAWSPQRMASKLLARDMGIPRSSDFFNIVTSQSKDYNPIGFAITYPVYKNGLIPESIEKRKENIFGYLAGVYPISSLFSNLLTELDNKKLNVSLYSLGNKELVFKQNKWEATPFVDSCTIDVYGSKWEISLNASQTYIDENFSNSKELYLFLTQFILGIIVIIILNILYKKNNLLQSLNKQIEEKTIELQDQYNKLHTLIDSSNEIIVYKDENLKYVECNEYFAKQVGKRKEEIIGQDDYSLWNKKTAEFLQRVDQKVLDSNKQLTIKKWINFPTKNKKTFMHTIMQPFEYEKNKIGVLIYSRDITEIENLKNNQLKQQELIYHQTRMSAIGTLLSNISHQWKQPLSMISTISSSLKLRLDLNEKLNNQELIESLDIISDKTLYLASIIDKFSETFSNRSEEKVNFNLKNTLVNLCSLIKDTLNEQSIVCSKKLIDIEIKNNEKDFIAAILNICNNATEAMVKNSDKDHRYLFIDLEIVNENVILTIKDSGGGIDESVIENIFDPYYTTKHQSVGTGATLFITYKTITEEFGGTIEAKNIAFEYDNKDLKGAEFIITLPIV